MGSTGWVRELNTWYRCTTTLEWYTDTGPSPCLRISSFFSEVWIEIYRPLKENVFYLTLVHVPTQFGVVFVFLFTLDLSFHICCSKLISCCNMEIRCSFRQIMFYKMLKKTYDKLYFWTCKSFYEIMTVIFHWNLKIRSPALELFANICETYFGSSYVFKKV